jgi:predicted dehydrogenase
MLRGAIVGLGNVALHGHLPGWLSRADIEIVAVTDTEPARRATWAERLPGARWYDDPEQLMGSPSLDFVDICTPPSSHATLIRQALAHRLHVLCEKPLVGSLQDLRSLVEQAAAADRVLHTVHNWHHAPIVRQTRTLVTDGAIGRVTDVMWHTLRSRPAAVAGSAHNWRVDPAIAGGGVLTDHGWHVCYILQRWIGAHPTSVSATLETRRHTNWQVEDTATLRLRFPDAAADVLLTWAADERRNWARLVGTAGAIEMVDDTLVLRRGDGEQRWSFASGLSDGSQHSDWFHPVTDQFVAEVSGEATDGANLMEASICVEVEGLARESHRRGGEDLPLSLAASLPSRRRELPV